MTMSASPGGPAGDPPGGRRRPLSPEQIRSVELPKTTLGRRGYSEPEVEQFVARLASDVEGWIAHSSSLRSEIDRLKTALRQWSKNGSINGNAAGHDSSKPHPDAVQVMSRAQQEADSILAQAQDYARRVAEYARQQYEEILRGAYEDALAEADRAEREHRIGPDTDYAAEWEELQRRLAWARTFLGAVQGAEAQLKAAGEAIAYEVDKLDGISQGRVGSSELAV
jgi:DivIVA domain-containing protein